MYGLTERPKVGPEDFVWCRAAGAVGNGLVLTCALPDGRCFGAVGLHR
jgi:hypothetical protein